jgi:hypothetical protein
MNPDHNSAQYARPHIRPHLKFAVQTWSPGTKADKECSEKVQRRAERMVSRLAARDCKNRLRELGQTTLEERRHQLDMQIGSIGSWLERHSEKRYMV